MAGIGDQCSNNGVKQFTEQLANFSGVQGYCMYASITSGTPKIDCKGSTVEIWKLPFPFYKHSQLITKAMYILFPYEIASFASEK